MSDEPTRLAGVRGAKEARLARALRLCGGAAGVLAIVLPLARVTFHVSKFLRLFSLMPEGLWSALFSGRVELVTPFYFLLQTLAEAIPPAFYLASVWFFCGYCARMVEQRLASRDS